MYDGKYGKSLSTRPKLSVFIKLFFHSLCFILSFFFNLLFKMIKKIRFHSISPILKVKNNAPKVPFKFPGLSVLFMVMAILIGMLGGCFRKPHDGAPTGNIDVSRIHNPVPHYLPKSKYGNPTSYVADGRRYYVLNSSKNYHKRGIASWYGTLFHGRLTSTHEKYNLYAMTAASPDLPIPCYVRVTNLQNGQSIIVKVNDRGPFAANRIIDLSYVAAKKLGYANRGTALVEVDSIDFHRSYPQPQIQFAHHQPKLYLQVAAFSRFASAENLKQKLERVTRRNIIIAQMPKDPHGLYHVQIGPLRNVSESDYLLQRIQQAGLGHAITVIG